MRLCSVKGCRGKHFGLGYCRSHHRRFTLYGDPMAGKVYGQHKTCRIEGCENRHNSRGMCKMHYARWQRTGSTKGFRATCTVEGCREKHKAHGFCRMHYIRWRKHGSPHVVKRIPRAGTCRVGCCSPVYGRGLCRSCYDWSLKQRGPEKALPNLPVAPLAGLVATWLTRGTVDALAERASVSVASIRGLGRRPTVSFDLADRLLSAMHRSVDEVYGRSEVAA